MAINTNVPPSTLTGARQTMMTWARIIETHAAIPEAFKDSCKAILPENHPLPYMVLAPAIQGGAFRATEKLLCEVNNILYIWESVGGQVVSRAYPLKTICTLEVGSILLNSWLKISGLTTDGNTAETVIPFNTATARHLAPFINKMRPEPADMEDGDWQAELAKFDELAPVSFKFMNFARESLVPGEKVVLSVWQPAIREIIFTMFGRSLYRTSFLAHLAILTDKEVILIRDDEHSSESRGTRYGGVWRYIPLRRLASLRITEQTAELLEASFILAGGGPPLNLVFEASKRQALQHFADELGRMVG